jgi:hypothetical protein
LNTKHESKAMMQSVAKHARITSTNLLRTMWQYQTTVQQIRIEIDDIDFEKKLFRVTNSAPISQRHELLDHWLERDLYARLEEEVDFDQALWTFLDAGQHTLILHFLGNEQYLLTPTTEVNAIRVIN